MVLYEWALQHNQTPRAGAGDSTADSECALVFSAKFHNNFANVLLGVHILDIRKEKNKISKLRQHNNTKHDNSLFFKPCMFITEDSLTLSLGLLKK